MTRRTGVIVGLLVALAAALGVAWLAWMDGKSPGNPPTLGSMRNFTALRDRPPAPETPLVAADGKESTLAAFRGRIAVVNFWATWCGPCVREMPSLERLARRFPADRLAVVALSQDLKGWPVIAPFLDRIGLKDLPIHFDPEGATARAMGVTVLPTTVLLGRDGRMLGYLAGAAEWDSDEAVKLLRHYLEEPAP